MTTAIPANAIWGVQWEAPVVPEGQMPDQPPQPGPDADETAWTEYNTGIAQWQAAVLELISSHDDWWQAVATTASDEAAARKLLAELTEVHSRTVFCRNTQLVWSQPVTWTVVE